MKFSLRSAKTALTAACLALLGACANPYRANFNSTEKRYPAWIEPRLSSKAAKPELKHSENIEEENWNLLEKGYLMIGFSKFDGPSTDDDLALNEAKSVGADIVMIEKKFSRTLTETVAMIGWPDEQTTETNEQVVVSGEKGTHVVNRTVETTTSGTPQTTYVPRDVDYYQYSATYWRKLERPVFGAFVRNLPDDTKQKLQTNQGLEIRAVIADSPAYKADLLKGDIILQIDEKPAPSSKTFYQDIVLKAGTDVELQILRRDQTLTRRVSLNR